MKCELDLRHWLLGLQGLKGGEPGSGVCPGQGVLLWVQLCSAAAQGPKGTVWAGPPEGGRQSWLNQVLP